MSRIRPVEDDALGDEFAESPETGPKWTTETPDHPKAPSSPNFGRTASGTWRKPTVAKVPSAAADAAPAGTYNIARRQRSTACAPSLRAAALACAASPTLNSASWEPAWYSTSGSWYADFAGARAAGATAQQADLIVPLASARWPGC